MFFELRSLLYALLLSAGLEATVFESNFIIVITVILLFFSIWEGKVLGKKWRSVLTPAVFSISSVALLYLIDASATKQIFISLSFIMYYLLCLGIWRLKNCSGDQTASGLVMAAAATAILFFYSATYGIYLNFFVPLWVLMLLYLAATFLVSYQYFRILKDGNRKLVCTYSLVLGLIMAEIAWVINFWPFGYLTAGIISLIFYYILWDLNRSYFLNVLSKKRFVANVIFFGFLMGIVLLSSKWLPVV